MVHRHGTRMVVASLGLFTACAAAHAQCEVEGVLGEWGHGARVHMDAQRAVLAPEFHTTFLVEVHRREGFALVHEQTLNVPVPDGPHPFIHIVRIAGDWLVVGESGNGNVFLYKRDSKAGWELKQTIEAPPFTLHFDAAIDGERLLLGLWPQAGAHLYRLEGEQWVFEHEFENPVAEPRSQFGQYVALQGERAAFTMAPTHVFVYERLKGVWTLAETHEVDGVEHDFGMGLAMGGETIVTGRQGRLYILEPGKEMAWFDVVDMPLMPTAGPSWFGVVNAINPDGTRILAGDATDSEGAESAGAAVLLAREDGQWVLQKKLSAPTASEYSHFARSLALADDFAIIGFAADWPHAGGAHLFAGVLNQDCIGSGNPDACDIFSGIAADKNSNLVPDECESSPGDLNGDGAVGVPDLLLLLGAWGECAGCSPGDDEACFADLNGDCAVGVADLLVLLANWG